MMKVLGLGAGVLVLALHATPAHAAAFTLTQSQVNQIGTWLGMAPNSLQLTSIFSKEAGDGKTPTDFHTAVDGPTKGRTITVAKVFDLHVGEASPGVDPTTWTTSAAQLIGGYNPVYWESINDYRYNPTNTTCSPAVPCNGGRTAFIFNLDTGEKQDQKQTGSVGGAGQFQTYNDSEWSPTWGNGWDLYFGENTSVAIGTPKEVMEHGYVSQWSYGNSGFFDPIYGPNHTSGMANWFQIAGFEVFSINENFGDPVVPEPGSMLLFGTGLAGIARAVRRRRAARTAA